jgi:protein-S-isoprenylcysteine O-methyltransferase Ste14
MTQPTVERGARVRFPPPLVFLGGMLAGVVVGRLTPAAVPLGSALRVGLGLAVLVAGLGLILAARRHFVRTGQSPIPWKPTPELIFQGPYRFTRNPMYVGATLVQAGFGVAVNNFWISVYALPALLIVHFIAVLPEERYLSDKFGHGYRDYLGRVRRYL